MEWGWLILFIIVGGLVLVCCCLRAAGWAEEDLNGNGQEAAEEKYNSE